MRRRTRLCAARSRGPRGGRRRVLDRPARHRAGENYTQAILEALDAARAIVLVFSSATNESPHVSRELRSPSGGHGASSRCGSRRSSPRGRCATSSVPRSGWTPPGRRDWAEAGTGGTSRHGRPETVATRLPAAPAARRTLGPEPRRQPRRQPRRPRDPRGCGRAGRRRPGRGRDPCRGRDPEPDQRGRRQGRLGQRRFDEPEQRVGREGPGRVGRFRPDARRPKTRARSPAGTTAPRPTPRTARCRRALRAWPRSSPG